MKLSLALSLACAISSASAALRGGGNGNTNSNIFDVASPPHGSNEKPSAPGQQVGEPHEHEQFSSGNGNPGNGNPNPEGPGNGNGQARGYFEMVNDVKNSLENGETVDDVKVRKMMRKYKQDHLKENPKKNQFKGAAMKVMEKYKGQGQDISEHQLVMETLEELTDQALYDELFGNLDSGFANPEDGSNMDPLAGEMEDDLLDDDVNNYDSLEDSPYEESYEEDHGRRLGVPTTQHRWANGVIRYTLVLDYNYAGYYMWANRMLPAMAEVEQYTNLQFELAGWVWTSDSIRDDGTVYLRATSGGCSATIGAPSSTSSWKHTINIGPYCGHGSLMHELLHTAGMHHQQVAQYRDKYITVNFGNIKSGYSRNFNKQYNHGLEFVYDYGSLMHYGEYGFSVNGGKTIDCGGRCGQRSGLSYWDQWEIIYFYNGYYFVNGNL
jgi:hypothetical protein